MVNGQWSMANPAKDPPTLKLAPPVKLQRHADGGRGNRQSAIGNRQSAIGNKFRAAQDQLLISNFRKLLTTDYSQLTLAKQYSTIHI
jgi:hypothetical protein